MGDTFVWYHDLKWTLAGEPATPDATQVVPSSVNKLATVELSLSDGTKVEFKIQSPDQLANMIDALERAI